MTGIIAVGLPSAHDRIAPIIDQMVEARLPVWWNQAIPGSRAWAESSAELEQARCVLIFLSSGIDATDRSTKAFRRFLDDRCAADRAVCVLLDPVPPPGELACSVYDLSDWRAAPRGWRKLLIGKSFVRDVMAAAQYKLAGRDPPPPSAARKLMIRQAAALFSAVVLPIVGVLSFAGTALGLYQAVGLADRPSAAERRDWAQIPKGSCDGLRAFVRKYPTGSLSDRARALYETPVKGSRLEWATERFPLDVYVEHDSRGFANEIDARADARQRADREGRRRCANAAGDGRLDGFEVVPSAQSCVRLDGGHVCDLRGEVMCRISSPRRIGVERCAI